MTKNEIINRTIEEREWLVQTHLSVLPKDKAIEVDKIAELITSLEQAYKQFLQSIWHELGKDERSLEDVLDKQYNRFALAGKYAEPINQAIADAKEITLWEQITNSNYKDIDHLNAIIVAYAKDLLAQITADFLEDVK